MALPKLGFVVEAITDTAQKGLAGLGDAIDSLRQRSQGFGQGLSDAFQEISRVNQEDAFGFLAMQEASGQLQDLSGQIQGLVGGYLDEAGQLAGEFEGVFAQIAQKSGAANDELQAMRDKALELGATTQHSASGVAAVMKDLAADGFGVADVLEATDKVLNFATAGEMKADEAGLYLSDIFAGFKPNLDPVMSTGEAFEFLSDQIATASDTTSLNVDQVAKTFLKLGPVAADAGVSFSDAAALVGAVSPVAKAEEAGTALKSIITSARVAASKEVEGLWEEMGYSFDNFVDENGQTDFLGILDFFRQAQLSADQVVTIFGKEFLPVANMLLSDEGFASAAELMQSQMEAAGKTTEIAGVNMEGTAGAAASLESAIEALKIKMGSAGVADFMQAFDGIKTKIVQFVTDLPEPVLAAAAALMGLVAGFGALGTAIGAWISGVSTFGMLIPKITYGLRTLKTQAIIPLIGATKTFLLTTIPTTLATLPALIAGFLPVILPILAAVLAIGFAAYTIYRFWKPIKAFFDGFAEGFMLQWGAMKATITEAFTAALAPLKELAPAFEPIKKAIAEISFAIFGEQLQTSGEKAKSWGKVVGDAFGLVVGAIGISIAGVAKLVGFFIKFGVALGEGLYNVYEKVGKFFGSTGAVLEMAKADFATVAAVVQSWMTLVSSGFRLAGQRIATTASDLWSSAASFGTYVGAGIRLIFTMLRAWWVDLHSLHIAPYTDPIAQAVIDVFNGAIDIFTWIGSVFTNLRSAINLHFTRAAVVVDALFDFFAASFTGIRLAIGNHFNEARFVLATFATAIGSGATMMISTLNLYFTQGVQFVGGMLSFVFQAVWGAISGFVIQPVMGFLGWIGGGVVGLVQAVWEVIVSMMGAVGAVVSELFGSLLSGFSTIFEQAARGTAELWAIVSDTFAPMVEGFRGFVTMLGEMFGKLRSAVMNFNPLGGGGGMVGTKESRNNATNAAAAGTTMGTAAVDAAKVGAVVAGGKVDTATAAGATAAAVGATTNNSKSSSVNVGNISVSSNATNSREVADLVINEFDHRVAAAL
jgi:TP901 family phage tail tape measure protein